MRSLPAFWAARLRRRLLTGQLYPDKAALYSPAEQLNRIVDTRLAWEVLGLICLGRSTKEIAAELGIAFKMRLASARISSGSVRLRCVRCPACRRLHQATTIATSVRSSGCCAI
jgi:hypothetical protein